MFINCSEGKPKMEAMFLMRNSVSVAVFMLLFACAGTDVARECVNGFLLPDGTCDCFSCWTGDSCSLYASRPPQFTQRVDSAILPAREDGNDGRSVYTAMATDPDEEFCKDPDGCPCSNVTYFIASQDETSNFRIDKYTGDVTLDGDSYSLFHEYQLTIGAGDDGGTYDTMTLVVHTGDAWDVTTNKYLVDVASNPANSDPFLDYSSRDGEEVLSRHRRAVTLPPNVTFTLSKYGANENQVEIKVGIRIQFKLEIVFPQKTTDMQVELFAPDSDNIVMMLCNVVVKMGSNLKINGSDKPVMESMNNSTYNDRAVIALGSVINTGADQNTFEPSTVTITYEAVMVENTNTVDSKEYWVSAGAEYNMESDVWVGQASFTAKTTDDSANFVEKPDVTFSGPGTLEIGNCANYNVDLTLNRPVVDLKLDVFAPFISADIMSICNAKVVRVNEAYQCGFGNFWNYTPQYLPEGNTIGYKHVMIDLKRPINKYAREYLSTPIASLKGLITFNVQICMNDRTDLVSNTYNLGAGVQIGSTTITTVQFNVTAAGKAQSHIDQSMAPSFSMSFPSGSGISKTKPVIIQMDMIVKENTSAEYLLEVLAPVINGLSALQVCTVKLVFAGENLACLGQRQFDTDYIISSNSSDSIYPDVAMVKLGTISNLGTMGWTQTSGNIRNTVSFQIIFKAIAHPDSTVGSVHDIYFGMFVGNDKLTVGKTNVTVVADSPASGMTTQNTPEINVRLGGDGNSVLPFGKTAQMLVDIKTFPGTTYSPFKIEFLMPNSSGSAMVNICKVKVVSVGANNPCFVAKAVERAVKMISGFNDRVTDRAIIELDSLCNIQQKNNETEDHIVLAVNVFLLQHAQFTTNPTVMISAGIESGFTGDTYVKMAQLSLQADSNAGTVSLSSPPVLKIVDNNALMTSIPYGYPARFLVRIKVPPTGTTPLSLNVSTADTDNALSLCAIRFARIGDGFPCVLPSIGVITDENELLGINKRGGINLGYVTNVGTEPLVADDSWDSNTIELEVVAKMSIDPALAPDGSTHTLTFVLKYGQDYGSELSATVSVSTTRNKSVVNPLLLERPSVSQMNVSSITGTDTPTPKEKLDTIVKSESKRLVISIDTVFNATSQLTVSVTTPMGTPDIMEVLYIGLLEAGENLPCVKSKQTKATYEPRQQNGAYTDIATVDLGYVCNVGVVNDTTGTANRLRVESVVRLLSSAKVAVGTTLQVHGAVNSNNTELLVFSVTLTVGDDLTYDPVYVDVLNDSAEILHNTTENPITVAISHLKIFPIVFTVPPFTSTKIKLDASMPTDVSAIMTVIDFTIVRSGRNLPKLEKFQKDFVVTESSKHNTSQVTFYTVQTGVISNAGVYYRFNQNTSDDDTFTAEFTLQMADCALAIDQSQHKVSFGLDISSSILILNVMVTASRTQTETVIFNVSSAVDVVNTTASKIEIDTILQLSSLSTAEAKDSILNIFVPVYAAYVSTVVSSPHKIITSQEKIDNAITLSFGSIFFTDEIHLTTIVAPNTSHPVPVGVTGVDSVFCMQPIGNTNTATDIVGSTTYLNFSVTTTPQGSSGCAIEALGMESGEIKDCQISSSPDSISGNEATEGRYNKGKGWSPFVHKGKVREERYFQVYFGKLMLVTKIKIQQQGPAWAKELGLNYSNDGLSWIANDKQLTLTVGSADQEKDVAIPQDSEYLRVVISDLDQETEKANFRFEFLGCETGSEPVTDPCTTVVKDPSRLPEFSRRTFMKAASTLYVCDGIKGKSGIEQKCYATTDDSSWRHVDSRVGSILGYNSEDGRLYAVSASADSYMGSLDGIEWFSVTVEDLNKAKTLTTYKPAIIVPVDGNPKLNSATPDSAFTDSGYGATIDGVMKNGAIIFYWNECCP